MRILALLGLGLPLAAVGGAVAYGSVSQISQSFRTVGSPVITTDSVPARPSEAARDFVLATAGSWDIAPAAESPQASAVMADQPDLAGMLAPGNGEGPATLGQSPFSGTDRLPEAPGPDAMPELDLAVVTERPAARPATQTVIRPRVVVSADRSSAEELRAQRAANQTRKREFKMPWQTGIFQ
ncbi:hypothetical protein [Szabonella alba]|uniref:Uncharacterized protein n=1 Tax=Szabonella alba TaxID=2804194 RepID=A0A8K0Y1J6_9RHOB|nr:hypothetical protein [Szabonella alba]MBL4917942.1 hypothetical protein [Szabonella alba]